MYRKHIIMIAVLIAGMYACNKGIDISTDAYKEFRVPPGFPAPVYDLADNPVTEAGFSLGKKLFNDPVLSSNNTISCSSCHVQSAAFAHNGHTVSDGIYNRHGTRNTLPIMNLAWNTSFMWDGGVFDLDLQPIAPITNHVEMGDTMQHILNKLRASDVYPSMFQKAFGNEGITTSTFLKALSQFMVMCISDDSKYDRVMAKQAVFTEAEEKGYLLFKQKCSSCHKEPLFTDNSFRNDGLSISDVDDKGRYSITLQDSDKYKFKVPGLRNVAFTSPYMHDGRLPTLKTVLDYYSSGQNNIEMTEYDKQNIISFLKTLSDRKFITNRNLSQ
jgi:cytochrome c peroxidase